MFVPVKVAIFVHLALVSLAFGAFVPPAEGPVPFRRDRLPIDADTMGVLSRQLVQMAATQDKDEAAEARSVAQMLALATALDPENEQSRELAKRLARGEGLPGADARKVEEAKNRSWHLLGWLEQPEAGADANRLAECLADILEVVDSEHPRAVELAKQGEQGQWRDWVSELEAFREKPPELAERTEVEEEQPEPEMPVESGESVALKLQSAEIRLPLWHTDRASEMLVLRPVVMKMKARIQGKDSGVKVKLPGKNLKALEGGLASGLGKLLEARYGSVPAGLHLEFELPRGIGYDTGRNGLALTGAVVVLADACFSGVAPTGIVYAEIDAEGELKIPARFWQTLRAMAEDKPGYRLVLPTTSSALLSPLVTLDKAEFFMSHEVLLADDLDDLLRLSSSAPLENQQAAHRLFDTIREARGSRSLGGFLSHESTQQRLAEVVGQLPEHASARMLALRGTPNWPKRLPREVFAREIRAAVAPIGREFKPGGWLTLDAAQLDATADACRDELGEVERLYASVGDRQELHAPAMQLVKLLKGLAADSKRSDAFGKGRNKMKDSFNETWREYARVVGLLSAAAGDGDDYPLPDPERFE
ncbi:MAG: hypothetical protein AAGI48_07970 [Verrucomicrobiota bacterium]